MASKKGVTKRPHGKDVMAKAIAYANLHGSAEASEKLGIPVRTINRWRDAVAPKDGHDGQLAIEPVDDNWARRVLGASVRVLEAGAAQVLSRIAAGDPVTPREIHTWAGVMKLANDAETTHRLLEERKSQNNSQGAPARPKPAPVVAIESKERAA